MYALCKLASLINELKEFSYYGELSKCYVNVLETRSQLIFELNRLLKSDTDETLYFLLFSYLSVRKLTYLFFRGFNLQNKLIQIVNFFIVLKSTTHSPKNQYWCEAVSKNKQTLRFTFID